MEKSRTLALEVESVIKELEGLLSSYNQRQLSTGDVVGGLNEAMKSPRIRLIKNLCASIKRDTTKKPNNISAIK